MTQLGDTSCKQSICWHSATRFSSLLESKIFGFYCGLLFFFFHSGAANDQRVISCCILIVDGPTASCSSSYATRFWMYTSPNVIRGSLWSSLMVERRATVWSPWPKILSEFFHIGRLSSSLLLLSLYNAWNKALWLTGDLSTVYPASRPLTAGSSPRVTLSWSKQG